jgi:hypothetical protein
MSSKLGVDDLGLAATVNDRLKRREPPDAMDSLQALKDREPRRSPDWTATMTRRERPGSWRRIWTALGGALQRGLLGKASQNSRNHFSGSGEYWARAIAAQLGWPPNQSPKPDPEPLQSSGKVVMPHGPGDRDTAGLPPKPEYEPVHGWTKRQLDDYLARNPGYKSAYEVALRKHCDALPLEGNGPLARAVQPKENQP